MSKLLEGITRPGSSECKNPVPHSPLSFNNYVKMQVVGPDDDGNIVTKQTVEHNNIMCTYGLASLASAVVTSDSTAASNWIQSIRIGTSATSPTSNDSGLGSFTAQVAVTQSDGSGTGGKSAASARVARWVATFASNNPANTANIQEIGLFIHSNTAQNTGIAAHSLPSPSVSKGNSDQIQVTYDIQFNSGVST